MARPIALISPPLNLPPPISYFIIFAAVISIFSAVTFLCGSHRSRGFSISPRGKGRKKAVVRLGAGGDGSNSSGKARTIEKMKSSLSNSKAALKAKMLSWRKVQDEGEAEDYSWEEEEDVVWKKAIMKGEKCRPIDFSGKILYDCDGNRLPD